LFEWQLYNAAAVGMGLDGTGYLYNNPLLCRGGIARLPWFQVPCCPSNLSRTWASLGKYIYSHDERDIWVHQYIGSQATIPLAAEKCSLRMGSSLPWSGKAHLYFEMENPLDFTLHVRIPSWAGGVSLRLNSEPLTVPQAPHRPAGRATACGYDPRLAWYLPVHRTWSPGDSIEVDFEMPIRLLRAHPRVRGHRGKIAITRGPLVYCLESRDNPDIDIHGVEILSDTLETGSAPDLLGGITSLSGKTSQDSRFVAIPYSLWANRGESQMSVWINCK